MEHITAVIVTFNPDIKILSSQYYSIVNQVDDVIYIDNGSENINSIELLLSDIAKNSSYCLIKNGSNLGLGFAHNQGIKYAIANGGRFILILDHDSVVKDNFVLALYNSFVDLRIKGINIGAVGPIYINESTNETYPITRYWGPFIKRLHPSNEPVEASVLISSGTLVSSENLLDIGLMNEELFVDYIDIEWSYRARSKGYKLFAVPVAVMNHTIGDNRYNFLGRMISIHSPLRRYYLSRNSVFMLRCSYISFGYKLRELVLNFVRVFVYAMISKNKLKYFRYSFVGLLDGIRGKFGQCRINK